MTRSQETKEPEKKDELKVINKEVLDTIIKEVQGAANSAAFMGANQGAGQAVAALGQETRGLTMEVRGLLIALQQYVHEHPEQEIAFTLRAAREIARFVLPDSVRIMRETEIKEMVGDTPLTELSLAEGFRATVARLDTLGEFAGANRARMEQVQDGLVTIREAQREEAAIRNEGERGRGAFHKPAKKAREEKKPKEHKISPELYEKRMAAKKCFKCGLANHRADKCPNGFMDEQGDAIM